MNHDEKIQIIYRIAYGEFFFSVPYRGKVLSFKGKDILSELLIQAQGVYSASYSEAVSKGAATRAELLRAYKARDIWTDKDIQEIESMQKEIADLRKRMDMFKYRKRIQREFSEKIEVLESQIRDKELKRENLLEHSAEALAKAKMDEYVLLKSIYDLDGNQVFEHISEDLDLLTAISDKYAEQQITETQLREVARSNPWRVMWTSAQECGGVFGVPSAKMTTLQTSLCYWSKVYDMAFNAMEAPSDDVIENDELFDLWLEDHLSNRGKSQTTESYSRDTGISNSSKKPAASAGKGALTITEVFEFADKEGAKEVHAKNDEVTQRFMQKQMQAIEEAGGVARDIQVLANMPKKGE